jgi:hypothetical protein
MSVVDMSSQPATSQVRVEKERADAIMTLSTGTSTHGCFFVARSGAHASGPERVSELLNSESDFFPFEVHDSHGVQTVLYNRRHVVLVALTNDEARRDPGYDFATSRPVAVVLSNGHRIVGSVRVYRPEGRDRLSDWAREPEVFRNIETGRLTVLVNVAHVIEVRETATNV